MVEHKLASNLEARSPLQPKRLCESAAARHHLRERP